MAHHGYTPLDGDVHGLGGTGKFPEGKLTENDEGEIRIAIGERDGKVVMDFGTPVCWIGFTPEQADDIARLLQLRSAQAKITEAISGRQERKNPLLPQSSEGETK